MHFLQQFQFLVDNSSGVVPRSGPVQSEVSWNEVKNKLLDFFQKDTPFDDIKSWVLVSVPTAPFFFSIV